MVIRRVRKRRFIRKRRLIRTGVVRRRRIGVPLRPFRVVRWSSADSATNTHFNFNGSDVTPGQDGSITFSLNNVQSSSEIINLFDNFRCVKVLYRWVISRTPDSVINTTYKGLFPRIVWAHDFNDSTPLSRAGLYQRAGLREEYMSENHQKSKWYSLKPAVLIQAYESPAATAYSPKWRQWLDTNDNSTPHYGMKYSIDQCYNGMSVRLEAKLIVEAKGIS